MDYIRWGVLSTARIAREKVIPAMQQCRYGRVAGIASRNPERAEAAASALGIDKTYGSYEDLLADPEIDAIYNPLPNHLHVPWTVRALEAGKHVLCEKPIALDGSEARRLLEVSRSFPKLKVMEAFMYRHHPQWQRTKTLVEAGRLGALRTIHSVFAYHNTDPQNVRNQADIGGGGLMDIGCYCISLSRFLFDAEPSRVVATMELDPDLKVDRLTSGMMEFERGTATFTCATQLARFQRVQVFGTEGAIEIEIPFNAPPNEATRIWLSHGGSIEEITLDACDQYTIQGDLFAKAILEDTPVPVSLEDAVANMDVIDAVRTSANERRWVELDVPT